MAQTRSTLTHDLHDVCSGTRSTTGTHVDIAFGRSLDGALSLGSDTTATTAKEASQAVTDTTGTAFSVTFVKATISLTATATENGLTRRLEASHVLQHLVDVLGELLVLHEVIGTGTGVLGLGSQELEHATSLRSIGLALTTGLTTTTGLLARLLRLFLLLLFLLFFHHHGSGEVFSSGFFEDHFVDHSFVHGSPKGESESNNHGDTGNCTHLLVGFRHQGRN